MFLQNFVAAQAKEQNKDYREKKNYGGKNQISVVIIFLKSVSFLLFLMSLTYLFL